MDELRALYREGARIAQLAEDVEGAAAKYCRTIERLIWAMEPSASGGTRREALRALRTAHEAVLAFARRVCTEIPLSRWGREQLEWCEGELTSVGSQLAMGRGWTEARSRGHAAAIWLPAMGNWVRQTADVGDESRPERRREAIIQLACHVGAGRIPQGNWHHRALPSALRRPQRPKPTWDQAWDSRMCDVLWLVPDSLLARARGCTPKAIEASRSLWRRKEEALERARTRPTPP